MRREGGYETRAGPRPVRCRVLRGVSRKQREALACVRPVAATPEFGDRRLEPRLTRRLRSRLAVTGCVAARAGLGRQGTAAAPEPGSRASGGRAEPTARS